MCYPTVSLRDIEELLFERGVMVSYETIRRWCDKFGASFAHRVKAVRRNRGLTWHLDEVFVKASARASNRPPMKMNHVLER
jgi:transposase-like protein